MSEFKVHHHVSELMNQLDVRSTDTVGAEVYTEMLLKNTTPYITTNVSANQAKRKIAESSKTPIEFLAKYDELKSKNVRDLDPLVFLMSKLSEEEQTKAVLEKNFRDKAEIQGATITPHDIPQMPAAGQKYTPQNVVELQMQLRKLKEGPAVSQVTSSEMLRKALREKQVQRNVNLPHQPEWLFQRSALTMDFIVGVDGPTDSNIVPLGNLPTMMQEQAILDDLLCCMQGIEGKYILARALTERYAPKEFMIDQSLDASLLEMVKRILPLSSNYSTVVRFIEEKSAFEYGLVNHALSSAMRTLVKDYMVLVAQLEQQLRLGTLSLQKLWFYIQPSMKTLEIMASIANSINRGECIGGAVLSLLHDKTSSFIGDVKGQELCLYLTQSACVPYFEVLEKWIYKGIINDPYSEFLVEENETINKEKLQEEYNDDYWEHHYTICRERIPVFLEQMADKILNTGKYLNVVRQCGRDVKCPNAEEVVYTLKEKKYFEQIERAYSYASKLLLDLLIEEKELLARIRSIKHYFLLDKGDFIVQFMDMTEDEMKLDIENIMPQRLESLLELALRTSTANVDPYKDDLKVDLLQYDLITQMFKILSIETSMEGDYKKFRSDPTDLHLSGLESFSFDYVVKWPVSLVLNRKALTRYQMLFRHLFYTKHVERQLCSVWVGNKSAKMYSLQSARWYSAAFALRQRMLNFVQNFEYYMMFEVVEPSWLIFESNMLSVSNVDDVLKFHTDFLNNCLKDCMLTNPQLLKIVHKLMMVCVTFSNYIMRLGYTTEVQMSELGQPKGRGNVNTSYIADKNRMKTKVVSEHVDEIIKNETFERTIGNFDSNFSRLLLELLEKIMEFSTSNVEVKLLNILHRLDFNGFYTEKLEALSAEKAVLDTSTHSSESG
ncbi:gamma-tubulin complex component 2-like [Ruditapes philippinarum]|uniref:gamma-tubulin complex component 2-like n=1 Tax=Ruditapes philippinarum TaxID=129788 RepID=UPI00295BE2BB|nr:gamma-tubulin complex component 2-like [Ruditapes philippinarum]